MEAMERRLTGKTVAVLAEDLYEDLELWYPTLRLREEGATVNLAGTGARTYRGKNGYPVEVDTDVSKLSAADLDAIVIPGGYAPDRLRRYPEVLSLVRDAFQQGKVVAAICHAAWVPISAGIVRGRRATCFFAIKDDLVNAGAVYEDAPVVVDGTFITSRQPSDLGHFCRAIIAALSGER
ncbi:MAG TPA: type 1 glutamine amidotransferase domain-containing protein [Dehalococcoidia bacterium]|nr:type 1 glutamine amidotransferase domain-containing protein [Dehalococcoidia bacterium]